MPLPWEEGRSIIEAVAAGDHELPDEPPDDPGQLSWAPGAWDGVLTHHVGPPDESRRGRLRRLLRRERDPARELADHVARVAEDPTGQARLALYEAAQHRDLVAYLDDVIGRLADRGIERDAVAPYARWLVGEGRHRGPVKLGIALLGVTGGPQDAPAVQTLAAHDEFALFCSVALQNLLDDPVDALWAVARTAEGWGKIHAVERLAPLAADRPEIRRWLLTDGCANSVMNEYLALECAVSGELAGALAGDVDGDLLDGACTILEALASPHGPAGDLSHYGDAEVAVRRLLDALERAEVTLHRLQAIVALDAWYEDGGPVRDRCRRILEDPGWEDRLRAAYSSGEESQRWQAWHAARVIGVDLWDLGFERLRTEGPDAALLSLLMQDAPFERREQLVRWAERELSPDAPPEAVEAAIRGGELFSPRLVALGLRSPSPRTRGIARSALEDTPRDRWGEAADALP